MDFQITILCLFQTFIDLTEYLCGDGVQNNVAGGNGVSGSHHTEFKFITSKRKRRSTVPVCGVFYQIRKCTHTCLQSSAFFTSRGSSSSNQLLQHVLQLLSQEYGDHCRWCLVSAQTLVISHISGRFSEEIRMYVHCLQNTGKHQEELDILVRSLSRIQQVNSVIRGQRPVVMFSGTIDTLEWLLMEQTAHTVTACHFFQCSHNNLVMIHSDIHRRVNRCQLMLSGSHLVVLCLRCDAQLPELFIDFLHISGNSLTHQAKIMVIHLLPFRRHRAE